MVIYSRGLETQAIKIDLPVEQGEHKYVYAEQAREVDGYKWGPVK